MEKHYHHFEDAEENKFIYTDIFQQYVCLQPSPSPSSPPPSPLPFHPPLSLLQTQLVESHLERELQARIPGFTMQCFLDSLE